MLMTEERPKTDNPLGIECPRCQQCEWKTLRVKRRVKHIRRRKKCRGCGRRVDTFEVTGLQVALFERWLRETGN